MSALTDALTAFAASDGGRDALTALFVAGAEHEAAHLRKHLDAYLLDARGAELAVANEWKARMDADTTSRITRVLGDG